MADELLAKALAAISRKDRTEFEMREWLAARDVEPDEIDRAVNFLIEHLALDDARYARMFTSDKRELSGWGRSRIRMTLVKKGVSMDLIEQALQAGDRDGEEPESEVDRAVRVLEEKGSDLTDDRGRQRALGLLARRGYDAEEAYAAIRIAARAA